MRTIIAGSRGIKRMEVVRVAMGEAKKEQGIDPTLVMSGTAPGVDRLGEAWAEENGIPVERWPADWDKYGKAAGYRRNKDMRDKGKAEALVAIWDGESPGTRSMIELARAGGLKVHVTFIEKVKYGKETDPGPRQNRRGLGQRRNQETY